MKSIAAALALLASLAIAHAEPRTAISMLGEPALARDFDHFPYADPSAVKGGRLRQAVLGTFDNVNPFVLKGDLAQGVRELVFEPLMARSFDEPFSLYGLIAEKVETPEDRSWVEFTLNPKAHFSDGKPVTQDDVIFSWELLKEHGRANHRSYYPKVEKAETVGEHGVRFTFKPGSDREMPLIMALMPVLPAHYYKTETFETPSMQALGSGPYVLASAEPPHAVVFMRDPNYWGRDLPTAKGRFNFDEMDYAYFTDQTALFEAFKAGDVDFLEETDAANWTGGYNFPDVAAGKVKKEEIAFGLPAPASAFVFNTRRPIFADQRVRKALDLLFDFEWINADLYHGVFTRLESLYDRSVLSSHGQPANEAEKALLAPFPGVVSQAAMQGSIEFPKSDGQGWNRDNARAAIALLKEAGYGTQGGVMTNLATGAPLAFEILAQSRSEQRLLNSYASQLKRVGIEARVRIEDAAQYTQRLNTFDFDMVRYTWYTSLSPGNEQIIRWSSKAADEQGSFNIAGVKSPAADAMIQALIRAKTQDDMTAAMRALDRVLLSGDYVIPLYYPAKQWVAYRSHLRYPAHVSLYGYLLDTWWAEPAAQ